MQLGSHEAGSRAKGRTIFEAEYSRAVQANGLGQYKEAFESSKRAARTTSSDSSERHSSSWWNRRYGHRSGRSPLMLSPDCRRGLRQVGPNGHSAVKPVRALVSHGAAAETGYHEAVGRLARTRIKVELARSHLLYGEWLRRERKV